MYKHTSTTHTHTYRFTLISYEPEAPQLYHFMLSTQNIYSTVPSFVCPHSLLFLTKALLASPNSTFPITHKKSYTQKALFHTIFYVLIHAIYGAHAHTSRWSHVCEISSSTAQPPIPHVHRHIDALVTEICAATNNMVKNYYSTCANDVLVQSQQGCPCAKKVKLTYI
jgi:hypothetical protein